MKRTQINALASLDVMGATNNMDNEIEVSQSKTIIKGVVNELDLHTSYNVKGVW